MASAAPPLSSSSSPQPSLQPPKEAVAPSPVVSALNLAVATWVAKNPLNSLYGDYQKFLEQVDLESLKKYQNSSEIFEVFFSEWKKKSGDILFIKGPQHADVFCKVKERRLQGKG